MIIIDDNHRAYNSGSSVKCLLFMACQFNSESSLLPAMYMAFSLINSYEDHLGRQSKWKNRLHNVISLCLSPLRERPIALYQLWQREALLAHYFYVNLGLFLLSNFDYVIAIFKESPKSDWTCSASICYCQPSKIPHPGPMLVTAKHKVDSWL